MPGAESLINVVKIGEVGRPFNLYKRIPAPEGSKEDETKELIWSQVIEPGDAIIMTLEANLLTKHEVPSPEDKNVKIGDSGSIVWRSICSIVSPVELQKKLAASRKQKAASKEKKAVAKEKKAAKAAAVPLEKEAARPFGEPVFLEWDEELDGPEPSGCMAAGWGKRPLCSYQSSPKRKLPADYDSGAE